MSPPWGKLSFDSVRKKRTGEVYYAWTVTGHSNNKGYVKAKCLCGIERDIRYTSLRDGSTRSCRCKIKPVIPEK